MNRCVMFIVESLLRKPLGMHVKVVACLNYCVGCFFHLIINSLKPTLSLVCSWRGYRPLMPEDLGVTSPNASFVII